MNEEFMNEAIRLAEECARLGEVPIGAVVVKRFPDGERIVGRGANSRESRKTALGHAELSAIADACKSLGGWRLHNCDLYVTLEPCPMCSGAAVNARIDNVYFGAYDKKNGCGGSVMDMSEQPFTHRPNFVGGIMEEECAELLRKFFRELRKEKKHMDINMIKADTDEQLLTVSRLADEIWHEYFPCILTAEQIDYMVEKFQSFPAMKSQVEKGYSYYIISRNGEYLGYTAVCPEEDGLFLSKLYIKKENRGKGYARQAFEFLKKLCAEKGYKFIRLTVNKYNADTIAVYEKLGFELLRSEVTDIGNGYVMDDFVYIYNMKG